MLGVAPLTAPDDLVDQILTQAPDAQTAQAMLLGSSFEAGWGPSFSVGDQGTSFGPYQIHLPAHPGVTPSEAEDPAWATQYMLPAYEAGVASVPQQLWSADPELAAEEAAVAAERPAVSYVNNYGQESLDSHWAQVQGAIANPRSVGATLTSYVPGTHIHIPGTGAGSSLAPSWLTGPVTHYIGYAVGLGVGGALVLAGLYKTANPSASLRQTIRSGLKDAGQAAAIGAVA